VLGDVVCGGFAMPIRENKAQEIYWGFVSGPSGVRDRRQRPGRSPRYGVGSHCPVS